MDSNQFSVHILALSDKLYRFARSILRDDSDAKDAVQNLSLKLWEKREKLDQIDNISAFTMQAMRNLCLDTIRRQRPTEELNENTEWDEYGPHGQAEHTDTKEYILKLINKLPEMQRTIIRLRDVEEMEISEIATIMLLTENAVSVNLSRARQKIRDKILAEQNIVNSTTWKE